MSQIKPHYRDDRVILADVIPLKMPFSIQIEASQVCNIRCNYCMQSFMGPRHSVLMSKDTFLDLGEQMADFGQKFKQVNFAGWGEPLVNQDLPWFINTLRGLAENIAVITNGILLDDLRSYELLKAGVNHIRVSMQGMTGEKYKEICGKEIDFKQFVENIRVLYGMKGGCQLSVKIADIALEPGEEELFYQTFARITDRMYIEKIRPMFEENIQDGKSISKYGIDHPPVEVCPQPFFMLAVTARGEILPCCSYYDPTHFGTLKTTSLISVWNSELPYFQKAMLRRRPRPICTKCLMPDAVLTPGDELDERREEICQRIILKL